ncbi:MAG: hypothetical protein GF317_22975, partial [Candidatus Lokiarchaeota archaeon]|nr:hypothetical protein [Candidatus Lokiarchaeota archaeon]MBD3202310.1 hypothetical protein [Candidatus Lokiarchaeota archaeon]
MVSKKVIGGIIAVVAVISIIALIPVFMYGFGVTVVELNTGYGLSTSSTSEGGYELQQYTGDYSALQAQQQQVDPYTYFFGKFNQHTSVSQQGGTSIPVNVDVNIH